MCTNIVYTTVHPGMTICQHGFFCGGMGPVPFQPNRRSLSNLIPVAVDLVSAIGRRPIDGAPLAHF